MGINNVFSFFLFQNYRLLILSSYNQDYLFCLFFNSLADNATFIENSKHLVRLTRYSSSLLEMEVTVIKNVSDGSYSCSSNHGTSSTFKAVEIEHEGKDMIIQNNKSRTQCRHLFPYVNPESLETAPLWSILLIFPLSLPLTISHRLCVIATLVLLKGLCSNPIG